MYVVLNQDKFNDITVICVCSFESTAKTIVEGRRERYKNYYCWYQKAEKVSGHAELEMFR